MQQEILLFTNSQFTKHQKQNVRDVKQLLTNRSIISTLVEVVSPEISDFGQMLPLKSSILLDISFHEDKEVSIIPHLIPFKYRLN